VVPGDDEERRPETAQEGGRALVLGPAPAVREVARDGDELRRETLHETRERALNRRFLRGSSVQVGDVEEPCWQRRSRLYTQNMADDTAEIFDDLYLGLRAGGALRKQRRGEPLTTEDQEALGRWERLSSWRKILAIGAFSVGTFGLGFTLGGLIFGRWRKA
jgi:hypothetical protein